VVVVGSRVVDAPLIQGFLDTRNSGKPRTVFQAMQSSEWQGLSALELRQALNINDQRLKALKVKSVRPDFYGQIGQIFAEAAHCIRLAVSAEIRSETCAARYDHRLEEWWRTWREEALLIHYPDHGGAEEPVADWAAYPDSSQYRHHVKLVHAVERVRSLLDASPAENLKLEVWSRWEPNKDRQLCLWASSVGPFLDTQIMRRDDIKVGSKYKSVQVFCAGAPMFLHEGDDEEGDTRWKSYFALPIWLEADDRSQLPVGVVSLASMRHGNPANRSQKPGSVSEANLKYIFAAISVMQTVGAEILSPS
jgi:hypothetical protein